MVKRRINITGNLTIDDHFDTFAKYYFREFYFTCFRSLSKNVHARYPEQPTSFEFLGDNPQFRLMFINFGRAV